MPPERNLSSFHVIQEDVHGRCTITWTFPSITEQNRTLVAEKCPNVMRSREGFAFFRGDGWIYILRRNKTNDALAIAVTARDFDPGKYEPLCDILWKKYEKTANPVDLVRLYLEAFATGSCRFQENGSQVVCSLKEARRRGCGIKELVKAFGVETVVIYNCLLLKKRVVVHHPDFRKLQLSLAAVVELMPSRNPGDYLHPYVESVGGELRGGGFFVAGVTNKAQNLKADAYDVIVDLQAEAIKVSPKAKGDLTMTKAHKEIATFLVQAVEKDAPEEQLIAELGRKTQELLAQVRGLIDAKTANGDVVTLEGLRSKKFSPAVENFLFNLAVAENIMMV